MANPAAEVVAEPADPLEEEFVEVDFHMGMSSGGAAHAHGSAGEWAPSSERPIIRPPVAGNPALRGRGPGNVSRASAGSNELGVEESEFDRPTFIRRGIIPPG